MMELLFISKVQEVDLLSVVVSSIVRLLVVVSKLLVWWLMIGPRVCSAICKFIVNDELIVVCIITSLRFWEREEMRVR